MSAGLAPDKSLYEVMQSPHNVLTEERDATERCWLLTEDPAKGVPHHTTLLIVKVAQCVQASMAAPASDNSYAAAAAAGLLTSRAWQQSELLHPQGAPPRPAARLAKPSPAAT